MARPHKQTVDYFPHYSNASSGKTLYILESKFGNDGYAFWFKLLELLANSEGHFYDARNPVAWEFLLARTHVTEAIGIQIMKLLIDLDAIDSELWDKRIIWSQNLVDNITDAYRNRTTDIPTKPSINGNKPLYIEVSDVENEVPDVINPHTKLNKNKLKDTKDTPIKQKYGEFNNVFLSDSEYQKLVERFSEAGTKERIEILSTGIASKGYKYKDHYATILAWEKRDRREVSRGTHRGHFEEAKGARPFSRPPTFRD